MDPSFLKMPLNQPLKQSQRSFYLENSTLGGRTDKKQMNSAQNGNIELYDAHNVDSCHWPQNVDGQYAQKFLTPLIKRGASTYIENVRTDLRALVCD